MPRGGRNQTSESRDWATRAAQALALAKAMPAGPARDDAIRKAEQLQSAADMKGYLTSAETLPK